MTDPTFSDLGLHPDLLRALDGLDYRTPTPIQQQAIPPVLNGEDLLGIAQTGTGKTAAFALPTLEALAMTRRSRRPFSPRALVLTPTRELALQVEQSFRDYGRYLGTRSLAIFGGVNQNPQVRTLRNGIDVLVATPGRLLDLYVQSFVNLKRVEVFVLDEADRMLDMGFINDVRKILAKLPEERQSLLFSATMPREVVHLTEQILHKPTRVEVTPRASTSERIDQWVYMVEKKNKRSLLSEVMTDGGMVRTLVFTRTKHGADRVVKHLRKENIRAEAIHGDKSQPARQRAMEGFRKGKVHVLVATDIAARGIDVDDITHVVNFDLPNVPETYVHRIGRTARAGRTGIALSFCGSDEHDYLRDIEKLTGRDLWVVEDHPFVSDIPYDRQPASKPKKAKARSQHSAGRRGSSRPPSQKSGHGRGKPASASGGRKPARGSRAGAPTSQGESRSPSNPPSRRKARPSKARPSNASRRRNPGRRGPGRASASS